MAIPKRLNDICQVRSAELAMLRRRVVVSNQVDGLTASQRQSFHMTQRSDWNVDLTTFVDQDAFNVG